MTQRDTASPESAHPELFAAVASYSEAFSEYAHDWKFSQTSNDQLAELAKTEAAVINAGSDYMLKHHPANTRELLVLTGPDAFSGLTEAVDDMVLDFIVSPSTEVIDTVIDPIDGNLRRTVLPWRRPAFKKNAPSLLLLDRWQDHSAQRYADMSDIIVQLQQYDEESTIGDALTALLCANGYQTFEQIKEQMKFLMHASALTR